MASEQGAEEQVAGGSSGSVGFRDLGPYFAAEATGLQRMSRPSDVTAYSMLGSTATEATGLQRMARPSDATAYSMLGSTTTVPNLQSLPLSSLYSGGGPCSSAAPVSTAVVQQELDSDGACLLVVDTNSPGWKVWHDTHACAVLGRNMGEVGRRMGGKRCAWAGALHSKPVPLDAACKHRAATHLLYNLSGLFHVLEPHWNHTGTTLETHWEHTETTLEPHWKQHKGAHAPWCVRLT